jgi:beta-N-acetylhexosaminidase
VTFNGELARAFPQLRSLVLSPDAIFGAPTGAAGAAIGGGTYVASPRPALLPAAVENALRAAQGADVVIVSSYFGASSSAATLAAPDGMDVLLNGLQKNGGKVVLATFSNPYIALGLPSTSGYLVAWGGSPVSQRAAARAMLGLAPITGQLPISIPSVAPYGTGLKRATMTSPAAITP